MNGLILYLNHPMTLKLGKGNIETILKNTRRNNNQKKQQKYTPYTHQIRTDQNQEKKRKRKEKKRNENIGGLYKN